ncbi:hypothetical protein F5Y13DRAFT_189204 [Hypoxylon sp. FL1857]|nr:hypothetical protein F5Y13DRAFT_189204 [Hypoxylon sp. FL1857]
MATTPNHDALGKRKADEITTSGTEEEDIANDPEESRFKRPIIEVTETRRWDIDMEMPQGKPRPKFVGELEEHRVSGAGTVEDPMIMWLGKIPIDTETKQANEEIARRAAWSLTTITHIYIRCAAQASKFVDRDGKRISIWNPDSICFHHETTLADPHISLALGTSAENLVLYGFINVAVDENSRPIDFATSRNPEHVIDGDDRIFELFPYEADQQCCAPYCREDHQIISAFEHVGWLKPMATISATVPMTSLNFSTTTVPVLTRQGD